MNKLLSFLEDFKNDFIEEFSSVRLAITLFIFLAVTTLIGTILPEEPLVGQAELVKKYGLERYRLLRSLGLTDVFHSWWYLALLTALGINILFGSFRKVFPRSVLAFQLPVELTESKIKKLPINCELPLNGKYDLNKIREKLKEKKYKTFLQNDQVLAQKGAWHRLGASITHVGIIILLIGALVSTLGGFNGFVQVGENEGFYLADLGQTSSQIKSSEENNYLAPINKMPVFVGRVPPYLIKVNKTWRDSYETGQPKQWYSNLSIFDESKKEVFRKTIHVNNPLEFMGLDIYQSSWGKFLNVSFNNESLSLPLESYMGEEVVFLPLNDDVGLKLRVIENKISSTGIQNLSSNYLELYSIFRSGHIKEKYLGKVEVNMNLQLGPINIGYFGMQTLTGLQFKSNPGNFLVYPGLVLIIIGVFVAFGSRRQIWAMLSNDGNKIVIGGNADRAKGKFFEEFEKIISELSYGKK